MRKLNVRLGAVCGALLFVIGCGSDSNDSPKVSATDVREEALEAVDVAAKYASGQRDRLAAQAQDVVDEAENELTDARREIVRLPAEAREQLKGAIDRAETAQERLGREIDSLQKTSADRWEDAENRISNALDEMSEAREEITAALLGADTKSDES